MAERESHLFLLWESARSKEQEILADIQEHFTIRDVVAVTWHQELFSENISRFYGQKLPDRSAKIRQCGTGPFLVILVDDETPQYAQRATSAASEKVNSNMFDAKERYREMTGGGHRVHGTNSTKEFKHDYTLLFHAAPAVAEQAAWDGSIRAMNQDLFGAGGWQSAEDLFLCLNETCEYLVLRNFEKFPEQLEIDGHSDVDVLARNSSEFVLVSAARKVQRTGYRAQYQVTIAGAEIHFDVRTPDDEYYDKLWAATLLDSRVLSDKGFYRPDDEGYFYSLLYHSLVHKNEYTEDYQKRLTGLAGKLAGDQAVGNAQEAQATLRSYMKEKGYGVSDPKDLSVIFRPLPQFPHTYSLQRRVKNARCALTRPVGKVLRKLGVIS